MRNASLPFPPASGLAAAAQMTFSQLAALTVPAPTKKMAEGMSNLMANLNAFFGHEPRLEEVTPLRCVRFFSWLSVHKKASTATAYQRRMCRILRLAHLQGMYPYNVDEFCEPLPAAAPARQTQFLSLQEVRLLEQMPCGHPCCKDAFLFACHTGLKLVEIEGLRWRHVVGKGAKQYLSLGDGRVDIPLCSKALAILDRYRSGGAQEEVFSLPSRTTLSSDLRGMASASGIDAGKMTFQIAKYTFQALMTQAGADRYVVSKLCGTSRPFAHGVPVEPGEGAYDHAVELLDEMMR